MRNQYSSSPNPKLAVKTLLKDVSTNVSIDSTENVVQY